MHILRSLILISCIAQSCLAIPMPQLFKNICSDTPQISYPARYNFVSFWLAQLHRPLIVGLVQDKDTGDKIKVATCSLHRIADLIMPSYLAGKSAEGSVIAARSGNIVAEELSLYGLKQYIGPVEYAFADGNIKIRKVAAVRILHKGLFKVVDKAIETQGNVNQSIKSGIRASALETAYIGFTQLVHNIAPSQAQEYVELLLPENAYAHTGLQNLTKLLFTSVASAALAVCGM